MDWTLLVGNTAIVCTIASNFAGLPICLDIVSRKSTAGVSALPFLTAAVCTSLWLQYGILIGDAVLAIVNLIAVFMQVCYLAIFYFSTVPRANLQRWLASSLVFLLSVHFYACHLATKQSGIQTLGVLASLASILASAAPLVGVVPNLIGALLSGLQLSLFAIFDSKPHQGCSY